MKDYHAEYWQVCTNQIARLIRACHSAHVGGDEKLSELFALRIRMEAYDLAHMVFQKYPILREVI